MNRSGSIVCHVPDAQMDQLIGAILLPEAWQERVLARLQLADEAKKVDKERKKLAQRLKRLGQVYLDELMDYEDYRRQKRQLEEKLASLALPDVDATKAAGELLENLPELWEQAKLGEQRHILMTMLEAVYVECKEEKRIVAIKPKPAFKPLFAIATTSQGSRVVLCTDDRQDIGKNSPCFRWRRGRGNLYLNTYLEVMLAAS